MKRSLLSGNRKFRLILGAVIGICLCLSSCHYLLPGYSGYSTYIDVFAAENDMAETAAEGGGQLIHASEHQEQHTILSFPGAPQTSRLEVEGKLPLEELQKAFPKIQAQLEDGRTISLPVSWASTEDYEASRLYWLAFYPVLPEEYTLAENVTLPCVEVTFDSLEDIDMDSSDAAEDNSEYIIGEELAAGPAAYNTNEWKTYTFLRTQLGLNNAAACGIMANIYAESRFDPTAGGDVQNGMVTSYGICQWHASRMEALIRFCQENGYDYTSLEGQLQYLKEEADGSLDYIPEHFPLTMNAIRTTVEDSADGAWRAGYLWCANFERPSNVEATASSRGNLARETFYANYEGAVVFTDVNDSSSFYYEPVYWALSQGITAGKGNGLFGTTNEDTCTRAQIVTFLYHAWLVTGGADISDEEAASIMAGKFTDVPADAYYFKPVAWALREGVTSGVSQTEFAPSLPCTREQAMTFLWKTKGRLSGADVDAATQTKDTSTTATSFEDVPEGQYYTLPIRWGVANGITSGVSATRFGVGQPCTRVQIVTFLYRAFR